MATLETTETEFEAILRAVALQSGFCVNDHAFDTMLKLGLNIVCEYLIIHLWLNRIENQDTERIRKEYAKYKKTGSWNF